MKKIIFIFIGFLILQKSYSQKNTSIEVFSGVGFNKDLTLINEVVNNYYSTTFQLNANYRFKITKVFFAETGIGTQWYFSSGAIGISKFNATTLRIKIPILVGRTLFKKVSIAAGIAISNNRDFDKFDYRADYNLRTSLLIKGNYSITNNFDVLLLIQKNLSDIPDLYLLNQPKLDLSIGISYKLF
tara:strand:+ start:19 stop:576 length:558 start_codon:yes stop_codon:yes gene_type:complete